MLSFRTAGYNGYSVQYSPFYDSKIACATASNFGLVGNGRLYVLDLTAAGIVQQTYFETQDGLFDLAWSETHENHIVTANGDGSLKLFDINVNQFPIQGFFEHTKEVFSVNWNLCDKSVFCSSSWDGSVKIWNPARKASLLTLVADNQSYSLPGPGTSSTPNTGRAPLPISHKVPSAPSLNCVYCAKFSPHDPTILASAHSDSMFRIWDTRSPQPLAQKMVFAHSGSEVLSLDWNKYRPTVLATGGVDKAIKIWDLRMIPNAPSQAIGPYGAHDPAVFRPPVNELLGHDYAVRNVYWSPHASDILLSASYDMTARVWQDQADDKARYLARINHNNGLLKVFNAHTEFVVGADWSLWGQQGWVATIGWDEMLHVWPTQ